MPSRVTGTRVNMPAVQGVTRPRKRARIRLVSLQNPARGKNQGAPNAESMNIYPFPFQGMWAPARHGHHPVFKVGTARRVGAWRVAATGTFGGNHLR
jgi:hypothetical protein